MGLLNVAPFLESLLGVNEMGIETFYKIKAEDFNKVTDRLEREFNANNFIGNDNFYFGMRRVKSEAKEWYGEVEFNASQTSVDTGNRGNFSKVLKSQIEKATKENRNEYVLYLKSILKFLKFYYSRF